MDAIRVLYGPARSRSPEHPGAQTFSACGDAVCDRFVEVTLGDQDGANISFDAGGPEGSVQWRLFYLRQNDSIANLADQLGVEILTGLGNVAVVAFLRIDLALGDFRIGVSATDSGLTIAKTVATDGDNSRIVTVLGAVVRVVR